MVQKTWSYSIASIVSITLLFVLPLSVQAQKADSKKDKEDVIYFPLYNGLSVSVDMAGLAAKGLGGDFLSSEIGIEANLKNRFLPIVELGYGTTDTWSEKGTHYKSSAPYFRIGMNYNTMYKKGSASYLYVGWRYAYSSFSYDATNLSVEDPIFGGSTSNPSFIDDIWGGSIPFNHKGLDSSMSWMELLLGVRAHIYKNIQMGWTIRLKYRRSTSFSDYGDPWYVPGFGEYKSSQMGLTYTIIYKLPF